MIAVKKEGRSLVWDRPCESSILSRLPYALFQSILDRSTCQLDQSLIIINLVLIIIRIIILLICAVRGHLIAVSFLFLLQCRNKNR